MTILGHYFLVLTYKDADKVYVPVYRFDLLQKHSDSETSTRLDDLKTSTFEKVRARAVESAKKLAFDLIELQAKRSLSKALNF